MKDLKNVNVSLVYKFCIWSLKMSFASLEFKV